MGVSSFPLPSPFFILFFFSSQLSHNYSIGNACFARAVSILSFDPETATYPLATQSKVTPKMYHTHLSWCPCHSEIKTIFGGSGIFTLEKMTIYARTWLDARCNFSLAPIQMGPCFIRQKGDWARREARWRQFLHKREILHQYSLCLFPAAAKATEVDKSWMKHRFPSLSTKNSVNLAERFSFLVGRLASTAVELCSPEERKSKSDATGNGLSIKR